jgi:hypothetical protein
MRSRGMNQLHHATIAKLLMLSVISLMFAFLVSFSQTAKA